MTGTEQKILLPENLRKPLGRVVEAVAKVFGTSVCLTVDTHPVLTSGKLRAVYLSSASVVSEAMFKLVEAQQGALVVPLQTPDSQKFRIIVGPFHQDAVWISGTIELKDASDEHLDVTVPRQALTVAYVSTVFETLYAIARGTPDKLDRASDEIAIENIRRVGASLAKSFGALGKDGKYSDVANSFYRIRPLREFVDQLAAADVPDYLTRIFQDLTAGLPVGFHLVDLLCRSLIKPTTYNQICRDIFRQNAPLECVLSDIRHVWSAIVAHRVTESPEIQYRYHCHGGFTEILYPIFAEDLAVGAIFGGQVVESETQIKAILARIGSMANPSMTVPCDWNSHLNRCNQKKCDEVMRVCRGLAGLTGTTFRQWCRAESGSGLRAGLIEASQALSLPEYAAKVCETVRHHIDITECSFWYFHGEKIVLLATTAEFFYVRSELEAKVIIKKPAQQLIEKAFYNLGEGLTGKVAKNRESLRVNNAQKTPGWSGKFSETPHDCKTAFMAIPLLREGELWGVIRALKVGDAPCISDEDFHLFRSCYQGNSHRGSGRSSCGTGPVNCKEI